MNDPSSRCRMILGRLLTALAVLAGLALAPLGALAGTQEVIWSQPPWDSGSKISSEDIPAYSLNSQVANDFTYPSDATITQISWWGGPYRTPDGALPSVFNIYIYDDNSCKPGNLIDSYVGIEPASAETGTDPGGLPIYRYDANVSFPVSGGRTYWISVQAASHDSPPQWGRQEATSVEGCESMIKSDYFGFPDWTLCSVPAHHPWDASEEIQINTPTIEACCLAEGACEMLLPEECLTQDGTPQGTGSVCIPNPCPEPLQACCAAGDVCTMETAINCLLSGGMPQGFGSTCEPNPCVVEACCLLGSCEMISAATCVASGGTPQGPGSVCDPNPCPPAEACCFIGGECIEIEPNRCTDFGGTPQGEGSACDPNPCAPPENEACCFPDGHCEMLAPAPCLAQGGLPQGTGTVCDPNSCPQPQEAACCTSDGGCTMMLPDVCVASGGASGGLGSTCDPNVCPIVIRTRPTTWGGIKVLYR